MISKQKEIFNELTVERFEKRSDLDKKCWNKKRKHQKKIKGAKSALYNIEIHYKTKSESIQFYDDYSLMVSEVKAKAKATKGIGLKILTSKQKFQRLPIAYAQVKAGNNSESLLNEIR